MADACRFVDLVYRPVLSEPDLVKMEAARRALIQYASRRAAHLRRGCGVAPVKPGETTDAH